MAMDGISTINNQGKKIYVVRFSAVGKTKEETLGLISAIDEEFEKNPPNSVLALIDLKGAFFHFDTFKNFKNLGGSSHQYDKKIAIIGLLGLMKAGFKTVASSDKNNKVRAFDSEQEAMKWLASD
jgi:hypothetical protein